MNIEKDEWAAISGCSQVHSQTATLHSKAAAHTPRARQIRAEHSRSLDFIQTILTSMDKARHFTDSQWGGAEHQRLLHDTIWMCEEHLHDPIVEVNELCQQGVDVCSLLLLHAQLFRDRLRLFQSFDSQPFRRLRAAPAKSVSIQDFELVKPIRKGAYGRVYLARKKNTGDIYAIKVMNKRELLRKNQNHHIQAERRIMSHADNPFVVKLFYSFQSKNHLYLVMEFINGGDIYSMLQNVGSLTEDVARVYAAELVLALSYLHDDLHVIHRDLKPDNILISKEGFIKLIDFGLSQIGVAERTAQKREHLPVLSRSSASPQASTPHSLRAHSSDKSSPRGSAHSGGHSGGHEYFRGECRGGHSDGHSGNHSYGHIDNHRGNHSGGPSDDANDCHSTHGSACSACDNLTCSVCGADSVCSVCGTGNTCAVCGARRSKAEATEEAGVDKTVDFLMDSNDSELSSQRSPAASAHDGSSHDTSSLRSDSLSSFTYSSVCSSRTPTSTSQMNSLSSLTIPSGQEPSLSGSYSAGSVSSLACFQDRRTAPSSLARPDSCDASCGKVSGVSEVNDVTEINGVSGITEFSGVAGVNETTSEVTNEISKEAVESIPVLSRHQIKKRRAQRKLHRRKDKLSRVGTPDYMAPELLLGTYSGPANDWWSVGVIVYELIVGFPPFNDQTPELIFDHIVKKEMKWPKVRQAVRG